MPLIASVSELMPQGLSPPLPLQAPIAFSDGTGEQAPSGTAAEELQLQVAQVARAAARLARLANGEVGRDEEESGDEGGGEESEEDEGGEARGGAGGGDSRTAAAWPEPLAHGRGAQLAASLGLDREELALLWSIVARTIDPRVAAHLRAIDARAREGLSCSLHAALRGLAPARAHALRAIADPRHPMRELGLIAPVGAALLSSAPSSFGLDVDTPWLATARIVDHLAGGDELDAEVALHGGLVEPLASALFDDAQGAVLEQLSGWLGAGGDTTILLEGPRGGGRRTAVACAAAPWPVVAIDGARIAAQAAPALVTALRREALLRGAVPLVANLDELLDRMSPAERLSLGAALDRVRGPLIATTATPSLELGASRRSVLRVRWPVPGVALRRLLWERAAEQLAAEELDHLAERYRLGAGGVHAAARSASLRASERGATPQLADLVAGVQDNIAERLGELARRVEITQRWDELVLPPDTEDDVRALIGRVRHAHHVLEGWGFRQKLPRGSGVAALFSGPPGTGKTMVAGLIARELSLELYQVDLSRIVSKWVGETEKQLAKVFEAAEAGHALLLFDEADALFAKRSTDVKSAVDRYANMEVNYLLQRIESFGGVVILTTNLDASIDPALRRRLASHIAFTLPETAERERLWREMLSTGAPLAGELDLAQLAEEFEGMSGANIRNAVLAAAFLAADEGALLGAAHLRRAARIEYRAMGHVLGKDLSTERRGGLR